jgi:hypothetical protein
MHASAQVSDIWSLYIDTNMSVISDMFATEFAAFLNAELKGIMQIGEWRIVENFNTTKKYKSIELATDLIPDDAVTVEKLFALSNKFFIEMNHFDDSAIISIRAMKQCGKKVYFYEL